MTIVASAAETGATGQRPNISAPQSPVTLISALFLGDRRMLRSLGQYSNRAAQAFMGERLHRISIEDDFMHITRTI
jgi:hypothetical protein